MRFGSLIGASFWDGAFLCRSHFSNFILDFYPEIEKMFNVKKIMFDWKDVLAQTKPKPKPRFKRNRKVINN